ncbi:glycosyltransferase family 2 protein [candidate division KSB1 bacterium]|nr:glycosyltransferase family 2 protein [candidate division KSB1 bacterium]
MDLSFIIVSYNSSENIKQCIRSLIDHVHDHGRQLEYEIIVVDNASSDDSVSVIETELPQVVLIKNDENRGYSAALNQGIAASTGLFVVAMNNDIEISSNIFESMLRIMKADSGIGILGCNLINPDGSPQKSSFRFPSLIGRIAILTSLNRLYQNRTPFTERPDGTNPIEVDCAKGALLLIRRDALDRVGVFDEHYFMYHEEMDLCYRFKQDGWKVCIDQSSKAIHHGQHAEDAANRFVFLERNKSLLYFHKKHYSRRNLTALIFINLFFFYLKICLIYCTFRHRKQSTIADVYKKVIESNLVYLKQSDGFR